MIKLGIIGCGAVTERLHLPALNGINDIEVEWLVDTNESIVDNLSNIYKIKNRQSDYRNVKDVDAVLVATPPFTHFEISKYFLMQGVNVLCEKPLTIDVHDAKELITIADNNNSKLAVGVFRRYYPISILIKRIIDTEWLGKVIKVIAEEGNIYDWGPASNYRLDKVKSGGGVLIETGSHTIDRIIWWLGPNAKLKNYSDNSLGGIESDCHIEFTIELNGRTVPIDVTLSQIRNLDNRYTVYTENGWVQCPANNSSNGSFYDTRLISGDGGVGLSLSKDANEKFILFFQAQLKDFIKSIQENRQPINAAVTVVPTVELINNCYNSRAQMAEPWNTNNDK